MNLGLGCLEGEALVASCVKKALERSERREKERPLLSLSQIDSVLFTPQNEIHGCTERGAALVNVNSRVTRKLIEKRRTRMAAEEGESIKSKRVNEEEKEISFKAHVASKEEVPSKKEAERAIGEVGVRRELKDQKE